MVHICWGTHRWCVKLRTRRLWSAERGAHSYRQKVGRYLSHYWSSHSEEVKTQHLWIVFTETTRIKEVKSKIYYLRSQKWGTQRDRRNGSPLSQVTSKQETGQGIERLFLIRWLRKPSLTFCGFNAKWLFFKVSWEKQSRNLWWEF